MHLWVTNRQRVFLKIVIYMSYYLKFFLNFAHLNSRFFNGESMASDSFLSLLFLNRLYIQLVSTICFDLVDNRFGNLLIAIN